MTAPMGAPMSAPMSTAYGVLIGWAVRAGEDPVRPAPDEARRWAQEELAKPAYGTSFLERFWAWLQDWLSSIFQPGNSPSGSEPVPLAFAIVALLVVAGIVATIVVRGFRKRTPAEPATAAAAAVLPEAALSAQEYRRLAQAALAAGERGRAVVEGFRAVAAQLLERHVLDEARDRTAREFAAAAGTAFPEHRAAAAEAARAFDATLYGGLPATSAAAQAVLDLDAALQRELPRPLSPGEMPRPLAAPR